MATKESRVKMRKAFEKATKLWQILAIALADLKACERMKGVAIDMDNWYVRENGGCKVCLAGAVIRCRVATSEQLRRRELWYSAFSESLKLLALDALRVGVVSEARYQMTDNYDGPTRNRCVSDYDEGKTAWWKQMKQLLADLKKNDE